MKKRIRLTETILKKIVFETVRRILNENSPNALKYDGETYEFAEGDEKQITLLFHNGKWIVDSNTGTTHRDMISYCKYGCSEFDLGHYYSHDKVLSIYNELNKLWANKNDEFKYMSRIYYTKHKTKEKGIKYILTSWDNLNEPIINSICNQLHINRNELIYLP